MRPNTLRILLAFWLLCHVAVVLSPLLFGGWAHWPVEAQRYAHWALYQRAIPPLPWQPQALILSQALLFLGWISLWWLIPAGRFIFLAGILLQLFSCYSTVPRISSGAEATVRAVSYLVLRSRNKSTIITTIYAVQ
jgi:hypothetical protein